jgi:hypothetical protein
MRFWDTSAIVPLLLQESATPATQMVYLADPDLVVWWATVVECVSAVARLERESAIPAAAVGVAIERLDLLARAWHEVQPSDRVRDGATRLLRVHPLRAADAFQLAAAIASAEDRPAALPFVTFDARLADAADREGFPVVSPAT